MIFLYLYFKILVRTLIQELDKNYINNYRDGERFVNESSPGETQTRNHSEYRLLRIKEQ